MMPAMRRHTGNTLAGTVLAIAGTLPLTHCQSSPSPAMPTAMETAAHDGWNHYGFDDVGRGSTVALGAVEGGETDVVVEGTIVDVCPKKGCWMRVTDGDRELFVRFKDYGFFVPMNSTDHRVVLHGSTVSQTASVEELRHYAEDAGRSAEEIAAITEPETRVTFFADAVYIEGDDLDPPHTQ